MTEPTRPCGTCGMPSTPGEYHPYAACLMFKACHNSETVRANLEAVRTTPQPTQAVPPAGREPLTEVQRQAIYDEHRYMGDSGWEVNWSDVIDAVEAAHGIKGKEAGNAE